MLALSNKSAAIVKEAIEITENRPKKKKETTKGGKAWLEEMVTKQEIIDRVGIIDPVIQTNVRSTLSNISYAGKTKSEVTNNLVNDLEKQVERLKYQRIKMLQEQQRENMKASRDVEIEEPKPPEDPEEELFERALKDKDLEKMEDIVTKRKQKLEEIEKKWREKKEMGQMKEAGLFDSNNYQTLQVSQDIATRVSKQYSINVDNKGLMDLDPNPSTVSAKIASPSKMEVSAFRGPKDRPLTQALTYQDDVMEEDTELKDMIKRSEKLRVLDPRRSDFQMKLANYLVGKKLKEDSEDYLESKVIKNFERYKSPESHRKSQEREKQHKLTDFPISHLPAIKDSKIAELLEKENRQNNFQAKSPVKVNKKKVQEINELFIIKLVFDALNHKNEGLISKDEALDYVMTNQDIVTIFDLKVSFNSEVQAFPTEAPGYMNFQEFTQIMMKRLPSKKQKDIKSAFPQEKEPTRALPQDINTQHPDTLLTEAEIDIFRKIFANLDQYEDLLIKTEAYLNALKGDMRVQKIMSKAAVKIPLVDKELTVKEILEQIEIDVKTGIENGMNTMQYISWNQFLDYFKTYKASKYTRPQQRIEPEKAEMLLSEPKMQIIQDVFDSIPRVVEEYVDKLEFVKAAKRDPQVQSFWKEKVDQTTEKTVAKIFDTILASEANYLKWEDVVPFFTRTGATENEEEEEGMHDSPTQVYKNDFQTFGADHISEAAKEDESRGDESRSPSPARKVRKTDNQKKVVIKDKKGTSKTIPTKKDTSVEKKEFDELDAELRKEYEMLQLELKAYGIVKKNVKDEKGLTIPKPFKFQAKEKEAETIRQRKVKEMVEQKKKEEEDALKFQFRANELPAYKHYDNTNRYTNIVKAQEERRMEITEKSKQITLANQKPFSFYERELNKPKSVKKEETVSQFKANPVPQFVKMEIFKDKEEQERKAREERIKKRIEENAVNSKLPPRMEMHEKTKQEGSLTTTKNPKKYRPEEPTFKPNIKKDVPDFDKLQKGFNDELQKKKKDAPKTQFKPFEFMKKESVKEASQTEEQPQTNTIKKKQAPKQQRKASATSKAQRAQTSEGLRGRQKEKRDEEEAEEEKGQEEQEPAEDEYPVDEDHEQGEAEGEGEGVEGGEEEAMGGEDEKGGRSNMEEGEEAKGEEGDFFDVESVGGGDEAVNPGTNTATRQPPKQTKEKSIDQLSAQGSQKGQSIKEEKKSVDKADKVDKKKPALTKKLEDEFERRKKEKEAREKRVEDTKKEDEMRKKKEQDFAPKVLTAFNAVNKPDKKKLEMEQRQKEYKERVKREQEEYNEKIKDMKNRIDSAPLMIENKLYGSKFLKKYREAIAKGWDTLEGPVGEAPRSETREEREERGSNQDYQTRKESFERTKTKAQETYEKEAEQEENNEKENKEEENYNEAQEDTGNKEEDNYNQTQEENENREDNQEEEQPQDQEQEQGGEQEQEQEQEERGEENNGQEENGEPDNNNNEDNEQKETSEQKEVSEEYGDDFQQDDNEQEGGEAQGNDEDN